MTPFDLAGLALAYLVIGRVLAAVPIFHGDDPYALPNPFLVLLWPIALPVVALATALRGD